MVRAASATALLALLVLTACKPKAASDQAAASSTAPITAPNPAATPAQADHHWVSKDGQEYIYVSNHGNPEAGVEPGAQTTVRYLGQQDGTYAIAEVQSGVIVVASCSAPCQEVRLRGDNLDQTLPLSPDSVVAAALDDARKGKLEKWTPPAAQARTQGQGPAPSK